MIIFRCSHHYLAKPIPPTLSSPLPHYFTRHQPLPPSPTSTAAAAVLCSGEGSSKLRAQLRPWRSNHVAKCLSTDAFVVAPDDRYGSKQVISLTPRLYDYILSNVREPEILRRLREETATMRGSQMQVSPDQGQLLAMLVQILGARRCIEVGVYTVESATRIRRIRAHVIRTMPKNPVCLNLQGYSSLAVALVLPDSGCLVACERDANALEVALRYYKRAGVFHKVHLKHGLAKDALKSLLLNGEADSYDFAFIDAEKKMYQEYFELLLQLVRAGGVIVIDNVLWHGKVADPLVNDAKTMALRKFNAAILEDGRVDISLVPIGDGITICRKR